MMSVEAGVEELTPTDPFITCGIKNYGFIFSFINIYYTFSEDQLKSKSLDQVVSDSGYGFLLSALISSGKIVLL